MARLVSFPSSFMGLPMRHAQCILKSSHGAQLKLMTMVYISVDRGNGAIVTQNVLVLVQNALSKKVKKVSLNCKIIGDFISNY